MDVPSPYVLTNNKNITAENQLINPKLTGKKQKTVNYRTSRDKTKDSTGASLSALAIMSTTATALVHANSPTSLDLVTASKIAVVPAISCDKRVTP